MSRKIRQRIYINLFIFIVLLVVLLIDNRKKVSFEFGQDDLQIYKELEGKSVVEDFFYVDGSYAGENLFIQSPIFTLDRGIYTISVKYEEGQCRATSYAELSGRRYSWSDVKSDSNILDSSGNVTYNIYVKRDNCEMRIRNSFTEPGDNGYLLIRNISVRSFRNQPVIYILVWVVAAVLVNAALSLKNSKKWQSDGNLKITIFWGFVIILISSYPVFADYMLQGHDMDFHLFRIEGLKAALEAGIFPAKIQPLWRDNSGYAVGVFYPDLFLYFPAVLRLAGVPIYLAYNSYILLMNVMTTCITYASFKRISDNKTGMLASMFYTLFPYRLMNIYVRSAVGEYTAMTFFPLVFCGLYEIYSYSEEGGNKEGGVLRSSTLVILGLSGVIQSHVLSTEMVGSIVLLVCLVLLKRTLSGTVFRQLVRIAVGTLLMNAGFLVPFLDFFREKFRFNSSLMEREGIQQMGLLIPQLFNINLGKFDNQSTLFGTTQERLGLGLCGILIVGLFVYGCIMGFAKNKWERRLCALMTFVTLFLTTCIFPYDLFQRILGRFSGIVINLQFPWRFLAIAAVMLTWMLCMLFQFFRGEYNRINILACVLGGCIVLQSLDLLSGLMNEGKVYRLYNTSAISTWTIHGWEYMPVGVWTEFPKEAEVVEGERATVATEHLMGRVKLNVNNSDEGPVHVDVPLVYYKYYIAVDETGRSFFVQNNGKGYVQVEIPPGYEGKITVRFKEPWIWRMAEVLSVLAVFCEVLIMKKDICYARKKRV